MSNIERIQCGNGNCYLVYEGDDAILIDTCRTQHRDKILEACKNKNVKLIVLTHGHVDHIQNATYLSKELNALIAMHKADYELSKDNMKEPLSDHKILGKLVLALSIKSFREDIIDSFEPEVFLQEGDALMNMFYPTKSMLYGDRNMMEKSARKISSYKDTTIYFGHGKPVGNRNW